MCSFKAVFLTLGLFVSSIAFAEYPEDAPILRGERVQPCTYWQYDSSIRGYFCFSRPWTITVATVPEVQRVIDSLSRKITDLEARVAALESSLTRED